MDLGVSFTCNKVCDFDYDTIVLSGGSAKGILSLGALQFAFDNNMINKVTNYIGTSAGAITCFLLIIGYTPSEIVAFLCSNRVTEKLHHFNIVRMMNGNGATYFGGIYEQLEKMTIHKIGYLPTMEHLKTRFNKNFTCVTYNLTDEKTEYLSCHTHPQLPCLIALKMSSNLPLIFENFKYGNKIYIDGGVSDNFPIDLADSIGKKVLGLLLCPSTSDFNQTNILEFIYKLIFIPVLQSIEQKVKQTSSNCHVVRLTYATDLKFFSFNVSTKVKLDIFSTGYGIMREFSTKRWEDECGMDMTHPTEHTDEIIVEDELMTMSINDTPNYTSDDYSFLTWR